MKYFLACLLALSSAPAFAQRWSSRPMSDDSSSPYGNLEGLYAGIGGGGQITITTGDSAFGYDLEGRLGYSFGPQFQLYLCGGIDSANFSGGSFTAEHVAACLQYHFVVRPAVMVYARGGVGVSLSSDFAVGSTAAGLMEHGGIGVEIRIGPSLWLAPELFYRNESFNAQGFSGTSTVAGLQLSLVYY